MLYTIVIRQSRAYTLAILFTMVAGTLPGICLSQSIVPEIRDTTISIHAEAYIDSIRTNALFRLDSVKAEFDSVMQISNRQLTSVEMKLSELKNRLDSIKVVQKVDSILHWKDQRLAKLTGKSDSIQQAIKSKLDNLPLPPEVREKANQVFNEISSLQTPLKNNIKGNIRSVGNLIPGVSDQIQSIASLGNDLQGAISLQNLDDLGNVRIASIPSLQRQIPDVPSVPQVGEMNAENVTEAAQQQLSNSSVASSVQEQIGEAGQLTSMISKAGDEEAVKQQVLQQVQQQATDHFEGKTEQLNQAISSIAKHKSRIPSVTSLNDIPKRVPNEMREKSFIERLVPGLALQMLKKDDLISVDFNVYSGYRITKRFTIGGGWNERVGVNTKSLSITSGDMRIYGPRMFVSFKLSRGFEPRAEIEAMNTFIPPYIRNPHVDPGSRRWVAGAFVGIMKTYNITKRVKGTAMIMTRLFDPNRTSPYPDVLNARFGFEIPIKKRKQAQ